MYFDWRGFGNLTRGLRGRISLAILLGLCASAFGIARVALLGVLLARVFTGADISRRVTGLAAGLAAAVLLRGLCDHARTVIAHQNAGFVQQKLRGQLLRQDRPTRAGGLVCRRAHRWRHAVID